MYSEHIPCYLQKKISPTLSFFFLIRRVLSPYYDFLPYPIICVLPPSLVSKESRNESVSDLTTPAQSLGVMGGFLSSLASPSPPAGGGEALSQPVALSPLTAGTEGGPPSGSDLMVGGGEDSAPSFARAVTASARELTDLIGWSGGAVDTGFFSFFILIVEIQHLKKYKNYKRVFL